MIRAKMVLESLVPISYGGYQVTYRCTYDPTKSEDVSFNTATPSGLVQMIVNNPKAIEQMIIGKAYYVDFTLVE